MCGMRSVIGPHVPAGSCGRYRGPGDGHMPQHDSKPVLFENAESGFYFVVVIVACGSDG